MIDDMMAVMKRINSLKKRFGMVKPQAVNVSSKKFDKMVNNQPEVNTKKDIASPKDITTKLNMNVQNADLLNKLLNNGSGQNNQSGENFLQNNLKGLIDLYKKNSN